MKDETNGNQTVLRFVPAQANHGEWRTDVRRDGAHREKKVQMPPLAAELRTETVAGGHQ